MDIATLIGMLLGIVLILMSILLKTSIGAFIDSSSVMVVIGGTIAALLIAFPLKQVIGTLKVFKHVLFNSQESLPELIEQIVSLAETARRDGLLALEGRIEELKNPFIIMGIQMAVDGTRPDVIEDVMRTEMDAIVNRHKKGKGLFDQMGRFAPAFGMIGTLMGLVIMLGDMSPEKIGPGMAVALLTTFYGAVVANLFCIPMAEKLGFISEHEMLVREIVVRGIMSIQAGDNPRVIEQKLVTFIPPNIRKTPQETA